MSVLYIRSQNKMRLEKVERVTLDESYEGNPNNFNGYKEPKFVGCKVLVNGKEFAIYKTTERALEVLDEICVALSGKVITQQKTSSKAKEKVGVVGESGNVEAKPLSIDTLYQMPQE